MKTFILKLLLPSWVLELAEQMKAQPSRCTAHPFWQVRYEEWVPVPESYSDDFIIFGDSEEHYKSYLGNCDELREYLWDSHNLWCRKLVSEEYDFDAYDSIEHCFYDCYEIGDSYTHLPCGLEKIWVGKEERIASTHLTEKDANWFIQRKQHDYPKLYTYVESAYWSPQLKQLQDWLKSLA